MANIKDVADKAQVSTSTVSRVLSGRVLVSDETKEKVMQAVHDLNYKPNVLAQGLKEGRTRTIGLIIPNVSSLVFPSAIRGITEVAKKYNYTVILCNTDEDLATENSFVENLQKRFIDGFIFSTATEESSHILELKEKGFPVILLIRHLMGEIDAVIMDNFKGGYEATRFLIERGYRKIALINGTLKLDLYQQRFHGYLLALKEADISFDERMVIHDISGSEDGYKAMKELWNRGCQPDAVLGTSDPKALGIMKAVKERGFKIPGDIAVMGYDNLEVSEYTDPPLTTMAQPFYEAGCKAAERLIKMILGEKDRPYIEKLDTKLIVRESVGYKNI